MTDWQRLEQIIKWTGLSTNAFAMGIGLKRSENLYQIKRGNNGISKDLAELISLKYPDVNRAWLLTGEGEMFVPGEEGKNPVPSRREGDIPYYNIDVFRLLSETGGEWRKAGEPSYTIRMPGFGDCDFAALLAGGRIPDVSSEAVIVLKEVEKENPVIPGEFYLILTGGYMLLKQIDPLDGGEKFLLKDQERQRKEEGMPIDREKIERLFLMKGLIIQKVR